MAKVILHITPKGLERVQLSANTPKEERGSWRLYLSLKPALAALEQQAAESRAGSGAKGCR